MTCHTEHVPSARYPIGARRSWLIALPFALLIQAATVVRAEPQRTADPKQTRRVLEKWESDLKGIDQDLVAGDGKRAYRRVTTLIETMVDTLVSGPAVAQLLGVATVLKAVAAVQLGRPDEGIWHWQVAQQLFPDVRGYTMSAYGDIGPFLKENSARGKWFIPPGVRAVGQGIEKPKKIKSPKPDFPAAKTGIKRVAVAVQAVIDTEGRVRSPVILDSAGEITLVCATLDTLRDWRFEPATMNGVPVPVLFNLTVNFDPR